MASIEIGVPSKEVQYINLSKTGIESTNGGVSSETCSVTMKFNDSPLLQSQKNHICAVTRFSVPLHQVHQTDEHYFDVYLVPKVDAYGDDGFYDEDVNSLWATVDNNGFYDGPDYDGAEAALAAGMDYQGQALYAHKLARVIIPPSYTIYQFNDNMKNAIKHAVDPQTGEHDIDLSERIRVVMSPDYRFSVMISGYTRRAVVVSGTTIPHLLQPDPVSDANPPQEGYEEEHEADDPYLLAGTGDTYWIKFSPGLFRMLQFLVTPGGGGRQNLTGRRFVVSHENGGAGDYEQAESGVEGFFCHLHWIHQHMPIQPKAL